MAQAYGLVEVLGRANAVRVLDQMCKAADVQFVTDYTRNGGHDTVVVSGSTSACTAAVDSVKENNPCPFFGAAVMSGPSSESDRIFQEWKDGNK
ncbi:MAG: BMC domain-containing protein [Lachnospiraceae bacterium]|nr:BMC domain-containing protein [Lachnospiraceae bacterium]